MLREYKFLGRNSGKISEIDDRENVPVNTIEAPLTHFSTESTRAPLHTIPEPTQSNKAKIPRTPVKDKGNCTPEKDGLSSKNRFGWAQKNELQDDTGNFAIHMGKSLGNLAHMTTPTSTRTMGRANSTHNTPTKSVSKPQNSAFCVASGSRTLVNGVGHRTGNFLGIPKGTPAIGNCSTIVNTVDVPYFDLKEDPSFWMEHIVQVVIRVRPLNNNERSVNGYKRCLKQESAQSITWIGHPETRFTFDHVACEAVDQEVDRKHAEMVEAQVALEELHQREALLSTENEMLKSEHANHMKKIYELEMELKKLSGQQNLQQRIHHHAKIKEENNLLKSQNEELSSKLRRLEYKSSRANEEFDRYYLAKGRKILDINFDEEHRLNCLLKEAKEEKVQLAQKLVGLCTSILKAAGTRPASDVSISAAEEALDQIKNRFTSLERELQDVKFKNRISAEKIRLSELMQQSPVSPRADGNQLIRGFQSPFLSSLDR